MPIPSPLISLPSSLNVYSKWLLTYSCKCCSLFFPFYLKAEWNGSFPRPGFSTPWGGTSGVGTLLSRGNKFFVWHFPWRWHSEGNRKKGLWTPHSLWHVKGKGIKNGGRGIWTCTGKDICTERDKDTLWWSSSFIFHFLTLCFTSGWICICLSTGPVLSWADSMCWTGNKIFIRQVSIDTMSRSYYNIFFSHLMQSKSFFLEEDIISLWA